MNLHFLILSIIFAIAYAQCPSGGTQLTNSSMNAVINSGQTYFITGDLTLNSISVSGTLYFKNVISIFKKYSKWTLKIFFPLNIGTNQSQFEMDQSEFWRKIIHWRKILPHHK